MFNDLGLSFGRSQASTTSQKRHIPIPHIAPSNYFLSLYIKITTLGVRELFKDCLGTNTSGTMPSSLVHGNACMPCTRSVSLWKRTGKRTMLQAENAAVETNIMEAEYDGQDMCCGCTF